MRWGQTGNREGSGPSLLDSQCHGKSLEMLELRNRADKALVAVWWLGCWCGWWWARPGHHLEFNCNYPSDSKEGSDRTNTMVFNGRGGVLKMVLLCLTWYRGLQTGTGGVAVGPEKGPENPEIQVFSGCMMFGMPY